MAYAAFIQDDYMRFLLSAGIVSRLRVLLRAASYGDIIRFISGCFNWLFMPGISFISII